MCGGPNSDINAVKSWLSSINERWLLVLDNCDDVDFKYAGYVPSGDSGCVLVTTRNSRLQRLSNVGHEQLEQLPPNHARELLLTAAAVKPEFWTELEAAADAIAHELGYHTLAVIHAGSYIQESECAMDEYLGILKSGTGEERLTQSDSDIENSRYGSVFATFEASARHLDSRAAAGNKTARDALHFLSVLAFLHHDNIHEKMFQLAADWAPDHAIDETRSLVHPDGFPMFTQRHAKLVTEFVPVRSPENNEGPQWPHVLSMLQSYSLVTCFKNKGQKCLSLHPLVHAWARERQTFDHQAKMWLQTAAIVSCSLHGLAVRKANSIALRSHFTACLSHDFIQFATSGHTRDWLAILSDVRTALLSMNLDYQIEPLLLLLNQILQTESNTISFDYGRHLPQEACTGFALGLPRSKRLYLQTMKSSKWWSLLKLDYDCAHLLVMRGRLGDALPMLERLFKYSDKNGPFRTTCQTELSYLYTAMERPADSLKIQREAFAWSTEHEKEDSEKLRARTLNLVDCLAGNGLYREAIALIEPLPSWAKDDYSRLVRNTNLTVLYFLDPDTDDGKAIPLLNACVDAARGICHDFDLIWNELGRLAWCYFYSRDYSMASELYLEAIRKGQVVSNRSDVDLLQLRYELALCYWRQKRDIPKAISLLEYIQQNCPADLGYLLDDADLLLREIEDWEATDDPAGTQDDAQCASGGAQCASGDAQSTSSDVEQAIEPAEEDERSTQQQTPQSAHTAKRSKTLARSWRSGIKTAFRRPRKE